MPTRSETDVFSFNARNSPLKFERSLFEIEGETDEPIRVATHAEAAELILDTLLDDTRGLFLSAISLVGTAHRVVHGADRYSAPLLVTASVVSGLQALADLPPLHNPPSLAVMEIVGQRLGGVPMAAVFDTAFVRCRTSRADMPSRAAGSSATNSATGRPSAAIDVVEHGHVERRRHRSRAEARAGGRVHEAINSRQAPRT